jgi:ADP-heptose:LPS heptosyltransferase
MTTSDPFTPGFLERLPERPRKVVLLRPSRIGDFLCATPALRALRRALPQAQITMITLPLLRELATRLPHFDRYEPFPGFPGIAEQFFDPRQALDFFRRMQAENFDLAIQMYGSGTYSNPFTLMLGARWTAGFVKEDWAGLLDAALPFPHEGHEVERILALSTFLGAPAVSTATEFPLQPEDRVTAARFLEGADRPFIGLQTGAREPAHTWAPERLGAAGAELCRRHGGTPIVLAGPEEQALAEEVAHHAGESSLNLAGKTSLPVLGAVIDQLSLLIANDSGPAHIAYALGTPAVVLFGDANPGRYGPPQAGPFHLVFPPGGVTVTDTNPAERRLGEITVEQVASAAEGLIE